MTECLIMSQSPQPQGGAEAVGGGNQAMPDRSLKTSQHVQYLR